jgi:hypothetical protein
MASSKAAGRTTRTPSAAPVGVPASAAARARDRVGTLVSTLLALGLAVMLAIVPVSPARAGDAELDVLLETTQHWLGTNHVLLSVYDASGASLAERGIPIRLAFVSPGGETLTSEPVIERFASYGRQLYHVVAPFDQLGRWSVRVQAEVDGQAAEGVTVLDVSADDGTPGLGSLVPAVRTPTMIDAHSLMHHISSDPEPLSAFYLWSLDDAVRQGQPTVFVLDSYAARPNAACGGALGLLHDVFIDYPGLVVVHAEPWQTTMDEDGMLRLDPPAGPPVLTDYSMAWGVKEPPWVFVIDDEGRLVAKFSGVVGSDELRAAIAAVTPWRPAA